VDDEAILGHLTGRHVMGVYPMLEDETCRLLAIDFDKASWRDDVAALTETCRQMGVPVSVERSRSGNGAHAWFFFTGPVAASVARRMGCYLITETMSRRDTLAMDSYDRLFPNQDTMPRGGFGNLIALPLQHEARKAGNTLFLDDDFEPHADQWAYLVSVTLMQPSAVATIAQEATRRGRVIGVRVADPDDECGESPWLRAPSGRARRPAIRSPLPHDARGTMSQRFFLHKDELPPAFLNAIRRIAAFQNPEFYKKQRMRLSTAMTPRVISCAEDVGDYVALPRGCQPEVEELLREHGVTLGIEDARQVGVPLRTRFHGELTPLQSRAARALLEHDIGVFVAPPGVGKTVLGTHLVSARGRNALVLVHRAPILEQWVAQLSMFLGIDDKEIGRIGGGKRKVTGSIDVAMIQTLVREGRVNDLVASYGHVIVDECHHVPAVSFERVMSEVKARYVLGLTATPHRRDGHHPILEMQLGPVRFQVDPKNQLAVRPFEQRLVVRETEFRLRESAAARGIQALYRELAGDDARNHLILDDVISALQEGRTPIVLTERRDHLEFLAERLRGFTRHLLVLRGGMTRRERSGVATRFAAIPGNEERLVLATGRYIGEGFDDARLDTMFLAMPVAWKGTLTQYAGRLHRLHPGKSEVRIYDYVDRDVPVLLRMFDKRMRAYRAIGYGREDLPPQIEPSDDRWIEYDEEALRHFGTEADAP
jgi:superfamily II DNA or RNA helicase